MEKNIYSIKMRASKNNIDKQHISGAERIIFENEIESTILELTKRALTHSKGKADSINIKLDKINKKDIRKISSLPITTINATDYIIGRKYAIQLLQDCGLPNKTSSFIVKLLQNSDSMRGAILLDIHSLQRLEKDKKRGIRVTNMDWSSNIHKKLIEKLKQNNLNNLHIIEAVALASKVSTCPGIIAELCWSDDPNYTTGYVASSKNGYIRITALKPFGDSKGGRIFCFDSSKTSIEKCINYLEKTIVLIDTVPVIEN